MNVKFYDTFLEDRTCCIFGTFFIPILFECKKYNMLDFGTYFTHLKFYDTF